MAEGIKVYNANGSLQLDLTSRAYRVVTVANVGSTTSGSVSADLSGGTIVIGMEIVDGKRAPTVTTNSGGASWNYGTIPTGERDPNFRLQLALF